LLSNAQTATCIKTSGVTQSCSITQASSTKNNVAVVYENAPKSSGLTQSASVTASISQQATGATNGNEACVTQNVNLDGSTTAQKGKPVLVTLDAHQSVSIKQDVAGSGPNQAFEAATSAGGCTSQAPLPATQPGIAQTQVLTSSANGSAAITQNEDTSAMLCGGGTTTPLSADANMCLDIEQNQNNGSPQTSTASGPNTATFDQENQLVALGNTAPGGSVTQTQGNSDPSVVTGLAAKINQNSHGINGISTFTGTQNEKQCEDAYKSKTPALPNPTDTTLCINEQIPPSGITVIQHQYGPEGMGQPRHKGPVGFLTHVSKDPTDSSQTGNSNDSFTVTQNSTQTNDSNNTQNNHVTGGLTTPGTGTVNQNVTLQGQHKVDVQIGQNSTVSGSIDCTSYQLVDCTKTLSTPTITGRSPNAPVFGTDSTTFTFSNPDPTVKFSCSLDGVNFAPCSGAVSVQGGKAVGTQTYSSSALSSGSHTFYVKTRDADNGNLSTGYDSTTWVITPPAPVIDTSPPALPATDPYGQAEAFTFHDNDTSTHLQCKIDSQPVTTCTSGSASYSGLASGPHTFSVTAYDHTDTYPSQATIYTFAITPPDPTISSGPGTGTGSQVTSTTATFVFADNDSTVKYECKLDSAATYTPCPSPNGNPTYSSLSHGPHVLDVKATDSSGNYESSGNAEYTWEVIPYLTFEVSDPNFGAKAGWSGIAGSSPITLTTGTDAETYAQFTIHDLSSLTVDQLQEPTFTTDAFSGGAPRYEIDFGNGDYAFGYPAQQNWGNASWDLNCGSNSCVPMSHVTWSAIQTAETGQTVTDALIEADFPTSATYNVTDFHFDGYQLSDFTN
jgi:hypothetical protein